MIDATNVIKLAKAANVKRFHTVPTIGEQNLGHHSHRVCLILRYLLNGDVPSKLLWAAIFHDLAESVTGDVPAQTKWASEKLDNLLTEWENNWHGDNGTYITLCDDEIKLLSVADKLELILYCTEQMMLGNRNMEVIRDRGITYVMSIETWDELGDRIRLFIEECTNEC